MAHLKGPRLPRGQMFAHTLDVYLDRRAVAGGAGTVPVPAPTGAPVSPD